MFYQEALPKVSCVESLLTIRDRYQRMLAATFEKPYQQIHFRLHSNECLFMWGAYFCMGAYKHNVVVEIKIGAYIYSWGVLFCVGSLQ